MNLFGGESSSVLSVLAVAGSLAVVFPFRTLLPAGNPAPETGLSEASAAFVELDERTEADLLGRAKESWRRGETGRVSADLVFSRLPERAPEAVLSVGSRSRIPDPPVADGGRISFLPSLRAAAPERIPTDDVRKEPLTFSRKELLKID